MVREPAASPDSAPCLSRLEDGFLARAPAGREPLGWQIPKSVVACLKAACAASDHHKRAALIHLGGFWLSLAHAPPAQIDSAMAARITAMERIQAELLGMPPTSH